MNVKDNVFGPHLILYGETHRKMNLDDLLNFHSHLTKKINMTPITNPVFVKTKKYATVFVAIAESHVAITLCEDNIKLDIFSCTMFDIKGLRKLVKKYFTIKTEISFERVQKIY